MAKTTKRKIRFRRKRKTRPRWVGALGKPGRGLNQSTYFFKRKISEVVALADSTVENGWLASSDNGVYKSWTFNLNQLSDITDFTNLFKQYKICGIAVDMCFNNTQSVITGNVAGTTNVAPGSQLQVYTVPNRVGKARGVLSPLTEQIVLNTQSHKKRLALNGGRPIKFYFKVNQLGLVYHSTTNSDYTVSPAKFLSTQETGTEHYGFEMYINRVDGQTLSSNITNEQSCRITTTYYLACRGVE